MPARRAPPRLEQAGEHRRFAAAAAEHRQVLAAHVQPEGGGREAAFNLCLTARADPVNRLRQPAVRVFRAQQCALPAAADRGGGGEVLRPDERQPFRTLNQ